MEEAGRDWLVTCIAGKEFQGEISHFRGSPLTALAQGQHSQGGEKKSRCLAILSDLQKSIRCLGSVSSQPLSFFMDEFCWYPTCTNAVGIVMMNISQAAPEMPVSSWKTLSPRPQCSQLPTLVDPTTLSGLHQLLASTPPTTCTHWA